MDRAVSDVHCDCEKLCVKPFSLYDSLCGVYGGKSSLTDIKHRPRYPWNSWCGESDGNRAPEPGEKIHETYPATPEPEKISDELNTFLLELENLHKTDSSKEVNIDIQEYVQAHMKDLFCTLARIDPGNFSGSVVKQVGSVGEQTKLGVYDEFDYLVELPQIGTRLQEEFGEGMAKINGSSEGEELFDARIGSIKAELKKKLFSALSPSWKIFPGPRLQPTELRSILTLSYKPGGGKDIVNIFLDVVFFFGWEWMMNLECVRCGRPRPCKEYYLLDERCNRVLNFMEMELLLESTISPAVTRTYKLAKLFTRDFIPAVCCMSTARMETLIPSYWLKQILLYMMVEYSAAKDWQEDSLGRRVFLLISWLQTCLQHERVSNYFTCDLNMCSARSTSTRRLHVTRLVNILQRLSKADPTAKASLWALRDINKQYSTYSSTELHISRFSTLVRLCKDGHVPLTTIQEYVDMHLPGRVTVRRQGDELYILYNNEEFSAGDFHKRFFGEKIPVIFDLCGSRALPNKYENYYNALLKEHLPDVLRDEPAELSEDDGWMSKVIPDNKKKAFEDGQSEVPSDLRDKKSTDGPHEVDRNDPGHQKCGLM